jgi:hypothetical protein
MGNPAFRSMNHELLEGSVDGTYKRFAPDRTNVNLPGIDKIRENRATLNWPESVIESPHKITPDGRYVDDY